MQTPAEKYLVQKLISFLNSHETDSNPHQILNVGAGQSVSIEQQLTQAGCRHVSDRIDIENCNVDFPTVGGCWQCSVDDMKPVKSSYYVAVYANYVLEHVENIRGASQEIYRVLAPGGLFVATLPNTLAPEFVLARYSPLWFHKLIRGGGHVWETKYAYDSISELLDVFFESGFQIEEEKRWPFVYGYLYKYPIIGLFGRLYDQAVSTCKCRALMGNLFVACQKPS